MGAQKAEAAVAERVEQVGERRLVGVARTERRLEQHVADARECGPCASERLELVALKV